MADYKSEETIGEALPERVGNPLMEQDYKMHSFIKNEVGIDPNTPVFITVKEYNDAELMLSIQIGDGWGEDQHDYDLVFFPTKKEAMRLRNALKKAQTQLTQWMREHRKRGGDW